MDPTSPDRTLQAENICSFPGCAEPRFAQNKVCTAHYGKLSWALDKSWYDVARWARWAGALAVVTIVLLLFL